MSKTTMPLRSLQQAMATVAPAVERKTTIPVLSSVRITPDVECIEFTATNLDLAIRAKVRVPGMQAAQPMLLPALKLDSYSKLLEGQDVTFTHTDETRATLRCGRSTTKLPLMPVANFPTIEAAPQGEAISLKQSILDRALGFVMFSVAHDESRYTLNGAQLEAKDGRLQVPATEGHRLSVYTLPIKSDPLKVLIPAAMLAAMDKTNDPKAESSCTLAVEGDNIFASFADGTGSVELRHRKLTGQFPNWEAVVPRDTPVIVRVDASELAAAVKRCKAFADERSGAVKLTISAEEIKLHSAAVDTGETDETIVARSADSFAPFSIGFKADYLLDALTRIEGDVALRLKDTQSALLIVDEPAPGEEFRYVVMPLRV